MKKSKKPNCEDILSEENLKKIHKQFVKQIKQNLKDEDLAIVEVMVNGARNSDFFENLHSGKFPSSATGDYSDVKVVTPFGEIPWNKLSRISDEEMGPLKDSMRFNIACSLLFLKKYGFKITYEKNEKTDIILGMVKNFYPIK